VQRQTNVDGIQTACGRRCGRRYPVRALITKLVFHSSIMREIVHLQAGQCGNQIGAKVRLTSVQKLVVFFISGNFGFCMGDGVFVTLRVCRPGGSVGSV
jgi:hypothetical protein